MDMHGSLSAGDACVPPLGLPSRSRLFVSGADSGSSPTLRSCYIGEHNGTYPNGTLGAGTFAFGHYVPTMVEKSTCQMANVSPLSLPARSLRPLPLTPHTVRR